MKYDFRIDILRNFIKIGEAYAESVSIRYNYTAEVMKGIQFQLEKVKMSSGLELDMFKDRVRPVLIHDGTETSLGIYMIMAAPKTVSDTVDFITVEGYDETMIVKQATFVQRTFFAAGTKYLDIVQTLLGRLGFGNIRVDSSNATLPTDLEAAVGDNYLTFINGLLDSINFQHLYADSFGTLNVRQSVNPTTPSFVYSDRGPNYSAIGSIKTSTDIYDLPNVVIGLWSSPDADEPVMFKTVNDDPISIISTVNRGYEVVKIVELRNAVTEQNLKDYVERIAFEAMQATEIITFATNAEGGHEPNTAIQLDTEDIRGLFIEKEWNMTISQDKFEMSHVAERKLFV